MPPLLNLEGHYSDIKNGRFKLFDGTFFKKNPQTAGTLQAHCLIIIILLVSHPSLLSSCWSAILLPGYSSLLLLPGPWLLAAWAQPVAVQAATRATVGSEYVRYDAACAMPAPQNLPTTLMAV
eukprot:SAG31_NODE_3784_length_3883_cov_1.859672_5_plen_123_part_00